MMYVGGKQIRQMRACVEKHQAYPIRVSGQPLEYFFSEDLPTASDHWKMNQGAMKALI